MSPLTVVRDDERDLLTDRQREILDFITRSITARGYPPTFTCGPSRRRGTYSGRT